MEEAKRGESSGGRRGLMFDLRAREGVFCNFCVFADIIRGSQELVNRINFFFSW